MIEQTLFGEKRKLKFYQQAPLPFQGQKRNFIYFYIDALKDFKDIDIFVDLFGGSGFLSHTTKYVYPDKRVIYNDFDNYTNRLEKIPITNEIILKMRDIMIYNRKQSDALSKEDKQKVLDIIESYNPQDRDIQTISSNICFGGKAATTMKELYQDKFYNKIKKSYYNADGYLEGVEIVHCDYKDLYNKYKDTPNVCFIADPPYFNTNTKTYTSYWRIQDYFDVFKVLKNNSFFYFTSEKSQIEELVDTMSNVFEFENPIKDAKKNTVKVRINKFEYYYDKMFYKYVNK